MATDSKIVQERPCGAAMAGIPYLDADTRRRAVVTGQQSSAQLTERKRQAYLDADQRACTEDDHEVERVRHRHLTVSLHLHLPATTQRTARNTPTHSVALHAPSHPARTQPTPNEPAH